MSSAPYSRILVASRDAREDAPLRAGQAMARIWDASLHVVHVLPPGERAPQDEVERLLQIQKAAEGAVRPTARIARAAAPEDGILAEAARVQADLVVIGVHEAWLPAGLAIGVAGRVIQKCPTPVLAVPDPRVTSEENDEGGDEMKIRKILCPIDFSEPSKTALRHASMFAEQGDAELVGLHVVEPIIYPVEYGLGPVPPVSLESTASENAKARLEELFREVVGDRHRWTVEVRFGRADDTICERAKEGFDLIVLATHGLTGIKHLLIGSVAERVVRLAPCPVLVVKQGQ